MVETTKKTRSNKSGRLLRAAGAALLATQVACSDVIKDVYWSSQEPVPKTTMYLGAKPGVKAKVPLEVVNYVEGVLVNFGVDKDVVIGIATNSRSDGLNFDSKVNAVLKANSPPTLSAYLRTVNEDGAKTIADVFFDIYTQGQSAMAKGN